MQELVMTTLHDMIDEAQHIILALHGRSLSHVCDAWCRAVTAGTILTVSDVQALLAPQGVLLTATVGANTPMGIQVIQHVLLPLTQGIPLLQYAGCGCAGMQYADSTTQKLVAMWNPPLWPITIALVQQGFLMYPGTN